MPRGRPKGTGKLTPNQTVEDAQTRMTVRLPTVLYDRLEAFAAGRHFHRGSPQLARCVREALAEYLARHTNRQTENTPAPCAYNNGQTKNGVQAPDVRALEAEHNNGQTDSEQPSPLLVDASKFFLGSLCRNGHDYEGTGQSLKSLKGKQECRECTTARQRKARQQKVRAKRQAQPVA